MLLVTDGSSSLARDRRAGATLLAELSAATTAELRVDGADGVMAALDGALRDGVREVVVVGGAHVSAAVATSAWRAGVLDGLRLVHVGGLGQDVWSRAAGLASTPASRWEAARRGATHRVPLVRVEHAARDGAVLGVVLAAGAGCQLAGALSDDAGGGALAWTRRVRGAVQAASQLSLAPLDLDVDEADEVEAANVLLVTAAGLSMGPVNVLPAAPAGVTVLHGALPGASVLARGPGAVRDALAGLSPGERSGLSGRTRMPVELDGWRLDAPWPAAFRVERGPTIEVGG